MARWVASLRIGAAASSTGFFGLVGVVAGVCVIVWVVGLCTVAKKDNRVRSKDSSDGDNSSPSRTSSKSPKKWMALSSKTLLVLAGVGAKNDYRVEDELAAYDQEFMEGVGELPSCVWQRTILMGERCATPEFSGVILYDEYGNRVQELPSKSPRAAAAPPPAHFK